MEERGEWVKTWQFKSRAIERPSRYFVRCHMPPNFLTDVDAGSMTEAFEKAEEFEASGQCEGPTATIYERVGIFELDEDENSFWKWVWKSEVEVE